VKALQAKRGRVVAHASSLSPDRLHLQGIGSRQRVIREKRRAGVVGMWDGATAGEAPQWFSSDNAQAVTYNPYAGHFVNRTSGDPVAAAGEVLCTIAPCLALAAADIARTKNELSLKNSTLQPRSYMILSKFIIQLQAP
jgi:hypothetical protein